MRTFVQVLVLELDETEGSPENWNWQEMIDTPGSVLVLRPVEVESNPTDDQVNLLDRLTTDYRDAVRREIGVIEEVES